MKLMFHFGNKQRSCFLKYLNKIQEILVITKFISKDLYKIYKYIDSESINFFDKF